MYQFFNRYKEEVKYLSLFIVFSISILLLAVAFKNDEKISTKNIESPLQHEDWAAIKKFLVGKINSPFINVNYEIKKGDNIQKILQKFEVRNNEIQKVISQFNKYSKPNQLLTGNMIEIIIEKSLSKKDNSVIKFSVPITKSTTLEIVKNEDGKLTSNKIITKLYKKRVLSDSFIKNNL